MDIVDARTATTPTICYTSTTNTIPAVTTTNKTPGKNTETIKGMYVLKYNIKTIHVVYPQVSEGRSCKK